MGCCFPVRVRLDEVVDGAEMWLLCLPSASSLPSKSLSYSAEPLSGELIRSATTSSF